MSYYEVEIAIGRNRWVELEDFFAVMLNTGTRDVQRHGRLADALQKVGDALCSEVRRAQVTGYRVWWVRDEASPNERELVALVAGQQSTITIDCLEVPRATRGEWQGVVLKEEIEGK